ncbi:MAG: multicopper oxidase domain-containing protein [Proteobacteria bacterium]|nr:multicopper oxidase domain-containing protein [Pseudomonadota bacterium]
MGMSRKGLWAAVLAIGLVSAAPLLAKVVSYTLHIGKTPVSFSGKSACALTINGTVPGPTLRARLGDELSIHVINHLSEPTSLHWHGVLVPNNMDGVPFVNQLPIEPGGSFHYHFPITHTGTYWYHAHAGLQEQQGLYGAIVLEGETPAQDKPQEEHVLVLSDWSDEKPEDILANIKKDPDYYALKKDSVQSWKKIFEKGWDAVEVRLKNAWARMSPMDLSDIGYDAFLINGKRTSSVGSAKAGARVKLRLVNAAASSYFMVEYAGGPMTVVAADGVDVTPFTTQRARMAMAETLDVLVDVPEGKAYELRASATDGTGFASAFVGQGPKVAAPIYEKPDVLLMEMDHGTMGGHDMANMGGHGMAHMGHDMASMGHTAHASKKPGAPAQVETFASYAPLRATHKTALPGEKPVRNITLKLTGSMERYVWTINDTPMYAADKIVIKKGEVVRFTLINETMMDHPIHIHGHFFRVLNGQGAYSPLKHTVSVSPFETTVIEMDANEDKDWIFHCHNLYHMKLGMGGVLHYAGSKLDPRLARHGGSHASEHGDLWFHAAHMDVFSNFSELETTLMHVENRVSLNARRAYTRDYEIEAAYTRYITTFLGVYVGGRFRLEDDKRENMPLIGARYTLPLLIDASLDMGHTGKVRFALANTHQLSDRLSFDWAWNTDRDYTLTLRWDLNKTWAIGANYDSSERFGVGLRASF